MILEKIAADTKLRVEKAKRKVPYSEICRRAMAMDANTGFPFEKALAEPGIHYICEVKKASPSKGVIAQDFPYLEIAREYEKAGAAAISCLTEPKYFQGKDTCLKEITENVSIPVLRKDFTIDEYMIYEAKTLKRYIKVADRLGLSALVEVHDEEEMQSAIEAGARVIGVNNRNLKDFTVDIGNSIRLRTLAPENVLFVAESGIKTAEDIEKLREAKVNGVLIGETLMRSPDKKAALEKLNGGSL